jgi:hypothetical protein
MNETEASDGALTPWRVRTVHGSGATDIDADEVWITLPNGIEFVLRDDGAPDGSLGAHIPSAPEDEQFAVFVVKPGASNLLLLNAEGRARRDVQPRCTD